MAYPSAINTPKFIGGMFQQQPLVVPFQNNFQAGKYGFNFGSQFVGFANVIDMTDVNGFGSSVLQKQQTHSVNWSPPGLFGQGWVFVQHPEKGFNMSVDLTGNRHINTFLSKYLNGTDFDAVKNLINDVKNGEGSKAQRGHRISKILSAVIEYGPMIIALLAAIKGGGTGGIDGGGGIGGVGTGGTGGTTTPPPTNPPPPTGGISTAQIGVGIVGLAAIYALTRD